MKIFPEVYLLMVISLIKSEPDCEITSKNGAGNVYNCSGRDITRIPLALRNRRDIKILDLTGCKKLMLVGEDFVGWKSLGKLYLSDIPMDAQRGKVPIGIFSGLDRLTDMHFNNSNLTNDEMWILPPTLKDYVLNNNKYERLNISGSPFLRAVQVENNLMNSLPIFHDQAIPIRMIMNGNPMCNLTYRNLAPFCNLRRLELDPPPGSYLLQNSGKCTCKQLLLWGEVFKVTQMKLQCAPPSFFDFLWDCDLSFADVVTVRSKCDDKHLIPLPWSPNWYAFVIKIVFVLVCVLLLLALIFAIYKKLGGRNRDKDDNEHDEYEYEED